MRLSMLVLSCLCTLPAGCKVESSPESSPQAAPEAEPTPALANDWQTLAESTLAAHGEAGTIIVLDAREGALLALAERPGRVEHPAATARHPASTIKPLVAVAAMAEGELEPTEVITCAGPREIEGGTFTCFMDHGEVDFERAMRTSCNHFAYAVAGMLTPAQLGEHLRNFGLGTATGWLPSDAGEEAPGHIPPAGGVEASIGHGELRATPLQVARAYAALATGRLPSRVEAPLPYTKGHLVRTHHALATTVSHTEGSGSLARVDDLEIAGKTGTAELDPLDGDDAKYLSWFASWAPVDDPKIVVVVQLESNETGPEAAALTRPIYEALAKRGD